MTVAPAKMAPIKRLFLFGAGASFGAGPTSPSAPPLGGSLFKELQATTQMWPHIPGLWVPAFQRNFEDGMLQLWNHGTVDDFTKGSYVSRFLHDMARYFARFRPLPGNAYQGLISALAAAGKFDGTVFATLNYECILETCLKPRAINYFDYAPSDSKTGTCWKLHGSCSFVNESGLQVFGVSFRIDQPMGFLLKVIDPEDVNAYCDIHTEHPSAFASPVAPSMAVFAPHKPFPFQPKQLMALKGYWEKAAAAADVIVVVGVRPLLLDKHIWDPLAATNAKVLAVGGPGDKAVFDGWAKAHRGPKPYAYIGDGFGANLEQIVTSI